MPSRARIVVAASLPRLPDRQRKIDLLIDQIDCALARDSCNRDFE